MKTTLPYAFSRLGNGCKRFLLLVAAVFSFSLAAVAAPYYWVGGSGNWSDVSHWASTSNGAGFAYIQAPTQNDDVYFNQWSFTGPGQVVTVNVAAVCNNLSTLGSTNLYTGVSAPAINIVGPQLDILGNVNLAAGMRYFNGTKRFIKDAAAYTLDFNSVPMSGSMIFDGLNSNFNLLSALAGNTDLVVNRGVVNSGNQSITLRSITISAVSTQRGLSLGSSTVNLNGAFVSPNTLASDPNLVMSLNNSTINLYSTSPAFALRDYTFNKINVYSTYGPSFTADITNTATIADLIFYDGNKVSSTGLVKITDSLTLSPGNTYALGAITLTAAAKFIANGTCGKKIQIVADVVNPLSATATIQKTGGWAGVNINSCILANVQFTGGGTVSATQSYTLGTTSGVTLLASTPTTYYWVGGTGVWDDGLHWALASGGTVSGCVPGPTDNVVFDGSSFTATGQTVNLSDSADTWCAAMNWTGSNYNPTFKYKTSPWNGSALYIGGSLTTISGMNWSVVATVNFVGAGTITSAGNSFLSTINFITTPGGYSLADNLLVNGVISFTSGQFNTNNYNVTSNGWVSSNNNNRILQTGSSLLFIYNYFSAALTSCFTMGGANLTTDFSNATINIRQMVNGYQDAYSFPPTLYKKVLIENPSNYSKTAGSVFLSATGATFDSLCLQSPTSLAGNMTFRKTLQLGSGTYLFGSLNVFTFQPAATISRFGTPGCANLITLANSYPGLTATFAKSSGSLLVDYAKLTYIKTSGAASFVANNSVDLGGNSGWVINTSGVSARTLYWVGNGG
ncbi:MAG TPA: hypothetical protein VL307_15450, partial [Chitinophagaceae bacterium]|nr:hypothetical protein [Chitinophagaceae bacterium]